MKTGRKMVLSPRFILLWWMTSNMLSAVRWPLHRVVSAGAGRSSAPLRTQQRLRAHHPRWASLVPTRAVPMTSWKQFPEFSRRFPRVPYLPRYCVAPDALSRRSVLWLSALRSVHLPLHCASLSSLWNGITAEKQCQLSHSQLPVGLLISSVDVINNHATCLYVIQNNLFWFVFGFYTKVHRNKLF